RHLLAVDGGDHVADLNACLFRRRAGLDLADQRAAVDAEPERIGEAGQNVLNADADAASLHLAVLEQLIDDLPHHVARDREADADIAARRRENRGVDAFQRAVEADERAARVARVDRGVGLNEILVPLDVDAAAAERADDTRGGGLPQAEWIADRDDEVADIEIVGVAELELAEVLCFYSQQRTGRRRIAADDLCIELTAVGERHDDRLGVLDDVAVRY